MSADQPPDPQFEIGHVLCVDVVGYSQLLINRQSELLKRLNEIVRGTKQFQDADAQGRLIRLPTGDGMALVFFGDPKAPIECATEIATALRSYPDIQLRMGIHSGPVNEMLDVDERRNVAGAGIDLAQRVMDCGDAGHILLSKRVAGDLVAYARWHADLHDLGECEVKHGRKLSLFNFYTDEVGNSETPHKLQAQVAAPTEVPKKRNGPIALAITAGLLLLVLIAGGWWFFSRKATTSISSPPPSPPPISQPETPEKSIAVLPLENLSDDKKDAFFADGIQDDILTSLAKIADLKVISRTSVMRYRGTVRDLREIGKALGVANILEGSVRHEGNRVLVNVQLIDALHDRHLWAERYDRTLADSIGLQGELAVEIAKALQAKLAPGEKNRLSTKPTDNPQAYLLYLQANEIVHSAASKEEVVNADNLYGQAIALDSRFALAYARGSILNSLMYFIGRDPARKTKAHEWADAAFRFGPDLGEAHTAMGLYFYRIDQDYDKALQELAIARSVSPNDSEVLDSCGYVYRRQLRWREALDAFHHAQELDPQRAHIGLPETLKSLRQWAAANEAYQHSLQLEPQQGNAWVGLAEVQFAQDGDPATARTTLERLPESLKNKSTVAIGRWDYAMMARDFGAAEKIVSLLPKDEFPNLELTQYYQACIDLVRGDRARAHELLDQIRPHHEAAMHAHSDDPKFHAWLGNVYALLGRKDDAIRESRHALDLIPESKDALARPAFEENLAFVYAQTGEVGQAVALLSRLLTTPGADRVTLAHLRLSWEWDPLRNDPGFQKILASPEPATIY